MPRAIKSDPMTIRLDPEVLRLLEFYAVTCFDGNRSKTIEHCIRFATAGLEAPKPPRQRNGRMPKP